MNLMVSDELSGLSLQLRRALVRAANQLTQQSFAQLVSPLMETVLERGFRIAGADAGAIWLVNKAESSLSLAYGAGQRIDKLVGNYQQPLSSGLISMVYVTGQPFSENRIQKRRGHSPVVDELLGVVTHAMIAVPFYFAEEARGVVSCVQFRPADDPHPQEDTAGFSQKGMREVELATASVQKLIDLRIIEHLLGWDEQ